MTGRRGSGSAAAPSARRGALADRVRGLLHGDDSPPEASAAQPPPESPAKAPPRSEPPTGPAPPHSPGPPRGSDVVHRRRRFAAIAGLLVAAIALVAIAVALHHSGSGGASQMATRAAPTRQITIPEGYDRRQIAAVAKQEGVRGDYMKASESAKGFDPAKYGAQSPTS